MKQSNGITSSTISVPEGIIDVHAHILPCVDDGARSFEESLKLIDSARKQGITTIIATPHYSRRQDNTRQLMDMAEQLNHRVRIDYPDFFLCLGQETYYHEELPERLQQGKALTLAGSRYVLVEFDPGTSWQTMQRGIRQLGFAGYIPVLAHMERYACLREGDRVDELLSLGCKMQMNYDSLEGHWYQSEPRWCRRQIKEGKIHLLGTDMHRMDFRPPKIEPAIRWMEKHISPSDIERLTRGNAVRILNHELIR
jgi:protein-tyrosine phosphatase